MTLHTDGYSGQQIFIKTICSNSEKYIVCVKIIDFSFMPKIIRTLSKDHVS